MKNKKINKIMSFAVLVAICFGIVSCNLNTDAKANEPKILTGPCGETAETSDDVVEINGQKYYTKKSNYYALKTDMKSDEAKQREEILNEDLYDNIRVKYWNEWIIGSYTEKDAKFKLIFNAPNNVACKGTPGQYTITKDEAFWYTAIGQLRSKDANILVQTSQYQLTNGFGTFIKDSIN